MPTVLVAHCTRLTINGPEWARFANSHSGALGHLTDGELHVYPFPNDVFWSVTELASFLYYDVPGDDALVPGVWDALVPAGVTLKIHILWGWSSPARNPLESRLGEIMVDFFGAVAVPTVEIVWHDGSFSKRWRWLRARVFALLVLRRFFSVVALARELPLPCELRRYIALSA